ncbi:GRAM domain-containing protein [Phthorimaea operculella]|nr:GRAM domain-containing protein [Phthorimaea operculella]
MTINVSRSPSPSLRNSGERTSEGADSLENDKDFCTGNLIEASSLQGELSIHVPSHPAGDTVSVSSASDIAPSPPPARNDNPKASTPNPTRSSDPAARVKKKSWYTSLYPTYKSKSDDFKRLFKDLPDDERLIVDYSCALQKDILAHGRLYASQNYLCFYASIFGWETNVTLRWKDVTAITKEKTALVIPNAILVCTEGEKNFLTSFSGRDKAYLMLFRIWQNALMDQPNTSHDIWQWVHSCYGEELGFGSDDEGYSRDTSLPALPPLDAASEVRWATRCGEELGFGSDDEGYSRDTSLPALPPLDAASEVRWVTRSTAGSVRSLASVLMTRATPGTPPCQRCHH